MVKVDWKLENNGEIIINDIDYEVEYNKEFIIYNDIYGKHTIDRVNKTYKRVGKNDSMAIDFVNNLLTVEFDDKKLSFDIETNYEEINNKIILKYVIGDDVKMITVTRKEDV